MKMMPPSMSQRPAKNGVGDLVLSAVRWEREVGLNQEKTRRDADLVGRPQQTGTHTARPRVSK